MIILATRRLSLLPEQIVVVLLLHFLKAAAADVIVDRLIEEDYCLLSISDICGDTVFVISKSKVRRLLSSYQHLL